MLIASKHTVAASEMQPARPPFLSLSLSFPSKPHHFYPMQRTKIPNTRCAMTTRIPLPRYSFFPPPPPPLARQPTTLFTWPSLPLPAPAARNTQGSVLSATDSQSVVSPSLQPCAACPVRRWPRCQMRILGYLFGLVFLISITEDIKVIRIPGVNGRFPTLSPTFQTLSRQPFPVLEKKKSTTFFSSFFFSS